MPSVKTIMPLALVVAQLTVATVAPALPGKTKVSKKHPVKVNPEVPVK
jgi:hypothetical protein